MSGWSRRTFRQFCEARDMTPAERVIAGHVRYTTSGYRMLYCPLHHAAQPSTGFVMEHRVIAERKIGRPLLAGEVVHHLNRDRLDNRPENLHVCRDAVEHGAFHRADHEDVAA